MNRSWNALFKGASKSERIAVSALTSAVLLLFVACANKYLFLAWDLWVWVEAGLVASTLAFGLKTLRRDWNVDFKEYSWVALPIGALATVFWAMEASKINLVTLWMDEALHLEIATAPIVEFRESIIHGALLLMPLDVLGLRFWVDLLELFRVPREYFEVALRLPYMLCHSGTTLLVAVLAHAFIRRISGSNTASRLLSFSFAATIFCNPGLLEYAIETRPYVSTAFLCMVIFTWAYLQAAKNLLEVRHWFVFVSLFGLCGFVHIYGAIFAGFCGAMLLLLQVRRRGVSKSFLSAGVFSGGVILYFAAAWRFVTATSPFVHSMDWAMVLNSWSRLYRDATANFFAVMGPNPVFELHRSWTPPTIVGATLVFLAVSAASRFGLLEFVLVPVLLEFLVPVLGVFAVAKGYNPHPRQSIPFFGVRALGAFWSYAGLARALDPWKKPYKSLALSALALGLLSVAGANLSSFDSALNNRRFTSKMTWDLKIAWKHLRDTGVKVVIVDPVLEMPWYDWRWIKPLYEQTFQIETPRTRREALVLAQARKDAAIIRVYKEPDQTPIQWPSGCTEKTFINVTLLRCADRSL